MRLIDAEKINPDDIIIMSPMEPKDFRAAVRELIHRQPTVIYMINGQPSADVAPVVHGRWIMTVYTTRSKRGRIISNKKFKCSECGCGNGRKQSNHCPNCGAKMDGAENE